MGIYAEYIDKKMSYADINSERQHQLQRIKVIRNRDILVFAGAHVRKDGEPNTGKDAWIVPLCHKCNSDDNKEPMDLNGGTVFVRVHMSESHKTACPEEDKQ